MGTPKAAVPSLVKLIDAGHEVAAVYTQPDRPSGRGNKLGFSPVKEFAVSRDLRVLQPTNIRTVDALDGFRSHGADVAVVVAYGRILPLEVLRVFPKGAINVHFSLLPKYRGAAPVNWAIVNGERETGVTTMKMDAGLDTGDIYLQESVEIRSEDDAIVLMDHLAGLGADLITKTLLQLDTIVPVAQEDSAATLAPIMRKEDGLIDWEMNAENIRNRIRGFQPFPTSFTTFRGSRLTLWRSRVEKDDLVKLTRRPGTIVKATGEDLMIECGGGSMLKIDELQLEGRRRVGARDFINGLHPKVGEKFGK